MTKGDQIYALALRFVNMATLVGLPPIPGGLDRFPRTADARCALVMRPAFDVALEEAPD